MMNGRQRLAAALSGQEPDRVPVMCQLSLGHYFLHSGLDPVEVWHSSEHFAEALVRLQGRYGFDGILVNLPGRDPGWRRLVREVATDRGRRIVRWTDGSTTLVPADDNPRVLGPAGAPPARPTLAATDPEALFYVEPHDIGGLRVRRPPLPPWQHETLRLVRDRVGRKVAVHGEVFSPFSQLVERLGVEEAMLGLLDDPGRVKACLAALAEGAIAVALGLAAAGADAVLISSAYAGAGFLSRPHYREFVLPFEARLIAGLKAGARVPVYTHTCGAIGDRLDLLEATGTDGIDTLDPPPLGTVDLAEAKRRTAGRLFLKGNLDPVRTLLRGTVDDVRAAARGRIEVGAPGGGYVLSSACSVAPHTPPENLVVLREVAEEEGQSPVGPTVA